jgi:hypothetical protein
MLLHAQPPITLCKVFLEDEDRTRGAVSSQYSLDMQTVDFHQDPS